MPQYFLIEFKEHKIFFDDCEAAHDAAAHVRVLEGVEVKVRRLDSGPVIGVYMAPETAPKKAQSAPGWNMCTEKMPPFSDYRQEVKSYPAVMLFDDEKIIEFLEYVCVFPDMPGIWRDYNGVMMERGAVIAWFDLPPLDIAR